MLGYPQLRNLRSSTYRPITPERAVAFLSEGSLSDGPKWILQRILRRRSKMLPSHHRRRRNLQAQYLPLAPSSLLLPATLK